jgi:hypothetical protein
MAAAEADDREALKKALPGVDRLLIVTGHNPRVDSQQSLRRQKRQA